MIVNTSAMFQSIMLVAVACTSVTAAAQAPTSSAVILDVISTRTSELDTRSRTDVFMAIPYEALAFESSRGEYVAQYQVVLSIRDSSLTRVIDTTYTRQLSEKSYNVSRGSTGASDLSVRSFNLHPGSYRISISIQDVFSKRDYSASREIAVPDYTRSLPALSSILYVNEIEQRGKRFRITPYVGDVIRPTNITLFAFFESYHDAPENVGFSWRISVASTRILAEGTATADSVGERTAQRFVRIQLPSNPSAGSYTLRIRMHPIKGAEPDTSVTLAERTRGLIIPRTALSDALTDLTKAIRQLRYVAPQAAIDNIESATSVPERQARFEEFWKTLDPTPNTVRNEAFDEYYTRVEQANKQFKSYNEGWLTDMGMVYIILGQPTTTERYNLQGGIAMRVVWMYTNNQSFIFEDNTGFGDYRLRTQMPPGLKYSYR